MLRRDTMMTRKTGTNVSTAVRRISHFACTAILAALVGIIPSLTRAQTLPTSDEWRTATSQAAAFLSRLHHALRPYDRVLQMRVARGVLTPQQAAAMLARGAENLAKGTVNPGAWTSEEEQEARQFFASIEQAAAGLARWPTAQPSAYYQSLRQLHRHRALAQTTRLRSERWRTARWRSRTPSRTSAHARRTGGCDHAIQRSG